MIERVFSSACKALSIAVVCTVSLAAATINNTDFPTFPMTVGGNTVYQFDIAIAAGEHITSGDFFRIYDFGGLTGTPTAPAGWTVSISNTNPTPPPNVILAFGDDPALPNITFTYSSLTVISGDTDILGFQATSTDALSNTAIKDAVALTTLFIVPTSITTFAGGSNSSINAVLVPGAPTTTTPEPSSLFTAGTALAFAGLKLLRAARRRSAVV